MSSLVANHKSENGIDIFELSGRINEDSKFDLGVISSSSNICFDFEKVTSINSCGIREWLKWIGAAATASKIVYKNCSRAIVDQINMVAGFLPSNGMVESFYVPYYSEDTDEEKMVLFTNGSEFSSGQVNAPTNVKDSSGNEMELDVIEDKYFKFLKS